MQMPGFSGEQAASPMLCGSQHLAPWQSSDEPQHSMMSSVGAANNDAPAYTTSDRQTPINSDRTDMSVSFDSHRGCKALAMTFAGPVPSLQDDTAMHTRNWSKHISIVLLIASVALNLALA